MTPTGPTIPIPEMKLRGVYVGQGRNFSVGVWTGQGLIGRRHKFGWWLREELHHDADPCFGTFRPTRYLHQIPDDMALETELPAGTHRGIPCVALNYALFGYLTKVSDDIAHAETE